MKSTIEETGQWQRTIAVVIEPEEIESAMDQVVARYRAKAVLPGFRPGKVPADVVLSAFGKNIENDLLNEILPEALEHLIGEHDLRLAAPPTVQDLNFKPGEPLTFKAAIDLWPDIDPKGYSGIEIEEEVNEVDDSAVDTFLENFRQRMAAGNPVARPSQAGDVLDVVILRCDKDGNRIPNVKKEEMRMVAGGADLLPAFREASIGVRPGDSPFVHLQYAPDFHDTGLAGQERFFKLKVTRLQERIVPELNDEFAQKVDGSASLGGLRDKIRLRMEAEEKLRARDRSEEVLIEKLIAANPMELSAGLLAAALGRALERARKEHPDHPEEDLKTQLAPLVERRWKRDILLDAIARKESIALTDEEFEERLREVLAGERDFAAARRKIEREGRMDSVRNQLVERKILKTLLDGATIHRILKPRAAEAPKIITP